MLVIFLGLFSLKPGDKFPIGKNLVSSQTNCPSRYIFQIGCNGETNNELTETYVYGKPPPSKNAEKERKTTNGYSGSTSGLSSPETDSEATARDAKISRAPPATTIVEGSVSKTLGVRRAALFDCSALDYTI